MKNWKQSGDVISVTAPAAVSSGDGVLVGSIFGIATHDAASGDLVEIMVTGVITMTKNAVDTWSQGDLIYWDPTPGEITSVVSTNKLIGVAMAAATAPAAPADVRLNGSFTT